MAWTTLSTMRRKPRTGIIVESPQVARGAAHCTQHYINRETRLSCVTMPLYIVPAGTVRCRRLGATTAALLHILLFAGKKKRKFELLQLTDVKKKEKKESALEKRGTSAPKGGAQATRGRNMSFCG